MAAGLDRDPLFVALTRPQMFAGVTYSYFVINGVMYPQAMDDETLAAAFKKTG